MRRSGFWTGMVVLAAMAGLVSVASAQIRPARRPVRHVFIIVLENESYSTSFGHGSPAPYLARTGTRA